MEGHIRKRGKTWQFTCDAGRDETGRRRQRVKGGFPTRREAERALRRVLYEMDNGTCAEPAKTTVEAYLRKWLEGYARANVEETTYVRYEQIVKLHLIPALGGHMLPELKPLHIQSYYAEAGLSGRLDGKGGLSPTTVLQHHRILREALQQAIKWRLLSFNPADGASPPKKAYKETAILDERQAMALIEAAEGTRYHMPIMLAVTTGMRRGEILGLRWDDVDLDAGFVTVRQTLARVGKELKFKPPKTANGRRRVDLPEFVVEALKAHRKLNLEERMAMGEAYANDGLVCARADGGHLKPDGFSNRVKGIAESLGLPRVTLHGLRHSHASHLFRQGEHPKLVSDRLGHSSIGITMDLYTHVMPGMQQAAAGKLGEALREASESR